MPTESLELQVAMTVPRTAAEGPGWRYALWVQGCPMRCEGCCNPAMLSFSRPVDVLPVPEVARRVALERNLEGVTFLGGEPFSQAPALAALAALVRGMGLSVMAFSGHTLAELQAMRDPSVDALLARCDLLVDGRYEAARRTTSRRWVGSDNQVMHFLTDRYRPDDARFHGANEVEIRLRRGEVTLNGWPVDGARTGAVTRGAPR